MIGREDFLTAMRSVATSVSIVTTDGEAGGRAGATVSTICSVSAEPPSLLVCVHSKASAAVAIEANGVFCVNLLASQQSVISDIFAGRAGIKGEDRFDHARWHPLDSGVPALVDAPVAFDCRLAARLRFGSHMIFIGSVEAIIIAASAPPLIHWNQAYAQPAVLA